MCENSSTFTKIKANSIDKAKCVSRAELNVRPVKPIVSEMPMAA